MTKISAGTANGVRSTSCGSLGRLRRFGRGKFKVWPLVGIAVIVLLVSGCQSMAGPGGGGPDARHVAEQLQKSSSGAGQKLSRLQAKLVEGALSLNGSTRLNVNGRKFPADCTGTVLAIYWHAGIDLGTPMSKYRGNGVTRLYRFLEDEGALYETRRPKTGDIIFWDNTYDRNEDGQPNDYLTHAGMVVSVEENGTLHFIHHNYRKGVVLARMNLYKPGVYTEIVDGQQQMINSPMRMRGSPDFDKWLASELTRSFGRAWEVVDKSAFLGG